MPKPTFLGKQIQELGIGTFRNIATVRQTATLYDALSIFVERRVSALPVVDDQGTRAAAKDYFHCQLSCSFICSTKKREKCSLRCTVLSSNQYDIQFCYNTGVNKPENVHILVVETDITASYNFFFAGKVVSLYSRFDVIVSSQEKHGFAQEI